MSDVRLPDFTREPVPVTRVRAMQDTRDWGYRYMNPEAFHAEGYTGKGVVLFVGDTGIDDLHPDLAGKVIYHKDFTGTFVPGRPDANGHGTWCASRVAANPNGAGVIGIAPGAVLGDLRVLDGDGSGLNSWVAIGIREAADAVLPEPYNQYRRVLSLSLGSPVSSPEIRAALNYAIGKGVFVICAAGNSGNRTGKNTMNFPAKYPESIAVGALSESGKIANYSSIGEELDVVAPGSNLLGAVPGGEYAIFSGTSMATPGVAGAVALILEKHGRAIQTQSDLEKYLMRYGTDLGDPGRDNYYGGGSVVLTNYINNPPDDVIEEPVDEPGPVDEGPNPDSLWTWIVGILQAVWEWIKSIFSNKQTQMDEIKQSAEQVGEFGYAEIVDTLKDGCKLEMEIRNKWSGNGGANVLLKLIESALAAFPKIDEAIKDWPQFESELLDLFPTESGGVLRDVEAALNEDEKENSRLFRVIRFAARGHMNGEQVKAIIDEQLGLGKDIFARS